MSGLIIGLLILSVLTGFLSFSGVITAVAIVGIIKILFFIFVASFVISLVTRLLRPPTH